MKHEVKPVNILIPHALDRRTFLRGAGVALCLPLLDAMTPALASISAKTGNAVPGEDRAAGIPRRLVAIQTTQGIMPELFFPDNSLADSASAEPSGTGHASSPYLDLLKELRGDFTVFSGVSHPGVDGGHANERSFLTGAPHPDGSGFRNSVSLDQFAADRIGMQTRFKSLVLNVSNMSATGSMSYSPSGVMIPAEGSPAGLYRQLFVHCDAAATAARLADLKAGRSLLDFVRQSAGGLNRKLGTQDRSRMDQYFTSVRELEGHLRTAAAWEKRPKPVVNSPMPEEIKEPARLMDRARAMTGVVRLALETDSTRVVSLFFETIGVLSGIPGVHNETHALTHHGNRAEMVGELRKIEEEQFRILAGFLGGLRSAKEESGTVLDRTMVLYGTCMGNANGHANTNWPMLLAGGGFRHGKHLAFDRDRNYPLGNLFVSMLQRLGLEGDRFATGTGTMRGLDMV